MTTPSCRRAGDVAAPGNGARDQDGERGAAHDRRLEGFESTTFELDGKERRCSARLGPAVIVISEMPGITPGVAAFARRVVDLGCTAVLPVSSARRAGTVGRVLRARSRSDRRCVSREFTTLATPQTSPVTTWLRALAAQEHERCGGPGVGVVGMCFTGRVRPRDDGRRRRAGAGAVASRRCRSRSPRSARPTSASRDADLARVKERAADRASTCSACGSRATGSCPGERFETSAASWATASSGSRSTRRRATRTAIRRGPTRCSPSTSSTSRASPPTTPSQQVLDLFRRKLLARLIRRARP